MKSRKLTKKEIGQRLEQEWKSMLNENGLSVPPDAIDAIKKAFKARDPRPEVLVESGLKVTLSTLLEDRGKTIAATHRIETEEELQRALKGIKEIGEDLPSVLRKAMKDFKAVLPRRGGPGRRPKLRPKEAAQMCDQIAVHIRQQLTLKKALVKASELTPQLLGKKVSPRTLQKAWDRRGELGTD